MSPLKEMTSNHERLEVVITTHWSEEGILSTALLLYQNAQGSMHELSLSCSMHYIGTNE